MDNGVIVHFDVANVNVIDFKMDFEGAYKWVIDLFEGKNYAKLNLKASSKSNPQSLMSTKPWFTYPERSMPLL